MTLAKQSSALSFWHGKPPKTTGGWVGQPSQPSYYSGGPPTLNWITTVAAYAIDSSLNGRMGGAQGWAAQGTPSPGGGASYFNQATGELANPCPSDLTAIEWGFFVPPPSYSNIATSILPGGKTWWTGLVLECSWSGTSGTPTTPSFYSNPGGSFTVNSNNSVTIVIGAGAGNVGIYVPVTNANDPPRDFIVVEQAKASLLAAGNFWDPDFLGQNSPFGIIRFMDWSGVITSGATDISQLANFGFNRLITPFGGLFEGVASVTAGVMTATFIASGQTPGPGVSLFDTSGALAVNTIITDYYGTNATTIGGTSFVSGDTVSLTVSDSAVPANYPVTVSHTLGSSESATTIATALAAAINANTTLQGTGVSATSSGAVITIVQENITGVGGITLSFAKTGSGNETGSFNPNNGTAGTLTQNTFVVSPSQTIASESMTGYVKKGSSYFSPVGPVGGLHPDVVCNLANLIGCNVHYNIPLSASDQFVTDIAMAFRNNLRSDLFVRFEFGNEPWNAPGIQFEYAAAQIYPGTGTTGAAVLWCGYNAARIYQIISGVYGPSQRSRWQGMLSGQQSDLGTDESSITGALYWVNNGAGGPSLTDLCDALIIAPYFYGFDSSVKITGATAVGATTTLNASNSLSTASFTGTGSSSGGLNFLAASAITGTIAVGHFVFGTGVPSGTVIIGKAPGTNTWYTNNPCTSSGAALTSAPSLRLIFSVTTAGTLGALLNGATVLLSAATGSTISFTNYFGNSGTGTVDTTGLTYAAGTNYAPNGALFDLMDTSAANNVSSPSSYPTPYTYFAEQVSKACILGTSDNGYVQSGLTQMASDNPTFILQAQLVANSYGLQLTCYEGGAQYGLWPTGDNLANNTQYQTYQWTWTEDTSQSGLYTIGTVYAAYQAAMNAAFSAYPAQFLIGVVGPWTCGVSRADRTSAKYAAVMAQNALGPFVDPTPPATGSWTHIVDNQTNASSNTQTFTGNFGNNAAGLVVVALQAQNASSSANLVSITVGGNSISTADVALGTGGVNCGIYSGLVPANLGNGVTITVVWSSESFASRTVSVYLLTGLISNTVQTTATIGGGLGTAVINETKGAFIIAECSVSGSGRNFTAGTNGVISPLFETSPLPLGQGGSGLFVADFSSPIFPVSVANASLSVATYR